MTSLIPLYRITIDSDVSNEDGYVRDFYIQYTYVVAVTCTTTSFGRNWKYITPSNFGFFSVFLAITGSLTLWRIWVIVNRCVLAVISTMKLYNKLLEKAFEMEFEMGMRYYTNDTLQTASKDMKRYWVNHCNLSIIRQVYLNQARADLITILVMMSL